MNEQKITKDELLKIIALIKNIKVEVVSMAQQISVFKSFSIKDLREECFPIITDKIKLYPELVMKIGLLYSASLKLHKKNPKETNS